MTDQKVQVRTSRLSKEQELQMEDYRNACAMLRDYGYKAEVRETVVVDTSDDPAYIRIRR